MFKIAIIDDEPFAIRNLKLLLNMIDLPIEIVGTASNGIEGLSIIEKKQPNIVFVDIQMPQMDGLEMIKNIRKEKINAKVIILSCHEKFSYARESIRLNIYDYIIKDLVSKEILEELLTSLIIEINQSQPCITNHSNIDIQISQQLSHAVKQHSEKYNKNLFQHLGLTSKDSRFVLFHLKLEFLSKYIQLIHSDYDIDSLINALYNDISSPIIISSLDRNLIILTQINCGSSSLSYYTECQRIGQIISKNIKEHNIKLYIITISKTFLDLNSLSEQYNYVHESSYNIIPTKSNHLNFMTTLNYQSKLTHEVIDGILQDITASIETLNKDNINYLIEKLFSSDDHGFIQLNYLNYINLCLFACLKQSIENNEIPMNDIFSTDYIPVSEIEKMNNIQEMQIWYNNTIKKIINFLEDKKNKNYSPKIVAAISIIEKKPSIALKEISIKLKINKFYLCRLFKEETGLNISSYSFKVRIDQAKHLLSRTDLKISDISEQLGYFYPHQFSSDFKKMLKITPTEYRRKKGARTYD